MPSDPPTISLPYRWPFSDRSKTRLLLTRKSTRASGDPGASFEGAARYEDGPITSEVLVTFAEEDRDPKLWPQGLHVESVQVEMPEALFVFNPVQHVRVLLSLRGRVYLRSPTSIARGTGQSCLWGLLDSRSLHTRTQGAGRLA